jgi:putative chitinase
MGERLGLDLEGNPTLAETPDVAVLTALEYWKSRNLSALADEGREDLITRRINGGTNGLKERRALVAKAKGVLM